VPLEKLVDLVSRFKSEKPPEIRLGETAVPVLPGGKRFQRAPGQITLSRQPAGNVVGDLNGQIHVLTVTCPIPPVIADLVR
jgi:hypothetical protein